MTLSLFEGDPEDTRAAIMHATYRALRAHGYAGLTIQRIGDEFPKSKSLLYHHYDSKDELLVDFLEFLLEHFKETAPDEEHADARERLRAMLDHVLPASLDEERREFTSAMTELRAQAPHDDAYRDQFAKADRYVQERITDVVSQGIDEGVFREVDPERTAAFLMTAITGARTHLVTTDDEAAFESTRRELEAYVESHLLAGGSE